MDKQSKREIQRFYGMVYEVKEEEIEKEGEGEGEEVKVVEG